MIEESKEFNDISSSIIFKDIQFQPSNKLILTSTYSCKQSPSHPYKTSNIGVEKFDHGKFTDGVASTYDKVDALNILKKEKVNSYKQTLKMKKKNSLFNRLRNYFIAGIVAIIPIGITLYLTMFIIEVSSKLVPKEINPNNYLPFNIPGVEILIALLIITFIGWLSLSFLGKKFFELFNNILKKIPILRTIYSAIGQMTESFTKTDN